MNRITVSWLLFFILSWISSLLHSQKRASCITSAAGLLPCCHEADIRMRSHRLLRLDDNRSAASCQQAWCNLIIETLCSQAWCKLFQRLHPWRKIEQLRIKWKLPVKITYFEFHCWEIITRIIIQIMNVNECNGKNIFMRWKMEWLEHSIFHRMKIFFHCTNEYMTPGRKQRAYTALTWTYPGGTASV